MKTSARKAKQLHATAHHEAEHAFVAWRSEIKFKYVTIKPGCDSLGHVLYRRVRWFRPDIDNADRVRMYAERRIIASHAGQIAEAKFRGRRPRYGMHADNQLAFDMAFRLCGSVKTAEAYLHYCWLRAQDARLGL